MAEGRSPDTTDDSAGHLSALDLNRDYFSTILPAVVVYSALGVLGVVGNCFVLYGYSRRYPRCSFKYFVLTLAVVDLVSCLTTIPGEVFSQYHWFVTNHAAVCKVKAYCTYFTVIASAFLLLLIGVDRFRKVCRPHGNQLDAGKTKWLCAGCVVLSMGWATIGPVFCGLQTFQYTANGYAVNVTVCARDDTFKDTLLPFLAMHILYVLPNIVTMVITAVLYGTIAGVMSRRDVQMKIQFKRQKTTKDPPTPENSSDNDDLEDLSASANDLSFADSEVPSRIVQQVVRMPSRSVGRSLSLNGVKDSLSIIRHRLRRKHDRTIQKLRRRAQMRVRQKTLTMFVLTLVYTVTTGAYLAMASHLSDVDSPLEHMTLKEQAILTSFFRVHLINAIISPIVYGFLDVRFRRALRSTRNRLSGSLHGRLSSIGMSYR